MAGSNQYFERCCCGAEIRLTENFEFISMNEMRNRFHEWKRDHKRCLMLFHEIQGRRMRALKGGYND